MALRAKAPEIKQAKRAKILISGEPGSGKTYFSLGFPGVYFIDTEYGAEREQYQRRLIETGGMYLGREHGVNTFEEVIKEVKALTTEKHTYKTVVIDSLSHIYNLEAAKAEEKGGSEFGRDKKMANIPSRQLLRWIDLMEMNVVLVAHTKKDWSNKEAVTTIYDAYDKTGYALDLWLEFTPKSIIVRKSRIETLQAGTVLKRDYAAFAELYGNATINQPATPVVMATTDQLARVQTLIEALNIKSEMIESNFKKMDVERWDDMTSVQIAGIITMFEGKLKTINGGK
jgi:hypothetical protein